MLRRFLNTALVAFVSCVISPALHADVIWGTVTHTAPTTQSGEEAVFLTAGTTGTFLGGTTYQVQGMTSGGVTFNISTNNDESTGTDQLFANTSVQLYANTLGSSDTSIDELMISSPGHSFTDGYMNLFGVFSESHTGEANTTVSFVVTTNDGTQTHIFDGLTDDNTDNWIFLTTTNGEYITSVSLSDTRFYALQNLTVSGVSPLVTTTPEPASMVLFGAGLLGLAGLHRRPRN